jgi:hypothetical protein
MIVERPSLRIMLSSLSLVVASLQPASFPLPAVLSERNTGGLIAIWKAGI